MKRFGAGGCAVSPRWGRAVAAGAAGLWFALLGGCDGITGSGDRDQAEVAIQRLGPGDSVTLVTSTDFSVGGGGEVILIRSDTQRVRLPFLRGYSLESLDRFFVEAGPAVSGDTTSIRMEVTIDGRDWYDEQATLGVGDPGVLAFVYRFNVPRF